MRDVQDGDQVNHERYRQRREGRVLEFGRRGY